MSEHTNLIQFRCDSAAHQHGLGGRTADTLTVHDGKWAYCPMDVAAADHDWKDTGGVRIEMLRRGSPRIDLDLDVGPHVDLSRPGGSPRGRTAGGTTTRKRATPKG